MKSDTKEKEQEYLKKLMDRVIKLRKEKKMSQETLANNSHIARSLMRGYERCERNISFANLVRIIKYGLDMTIEEFFSEGFDVPLKDSSKQQPRSE